MGPLSGVSRGVVLLGLITTTRCGSPGFTYTKFPITDTYASTCNSIYEQYDTEPYLLVRENNPDYYLTEAHVDTNLCGVAEMGDRVAYLKFDLRDFSFDAVGSAVFRATPDGFPPDMEVHVYAGCHSDHLEDGGVRWTNRPTGGYQRCVWVGDADALRDSATRGCDLTHDVRDAAGRELCVKLVGNAAAAAPERLYEAARFWSTDAPHAPAGWHTDADDRRGFGAGAVGRGTVPGVEFTVAPHLRINGSDCGALFPDYRGAGCGPDYGAVSRNVFTPGPTAAPIPRPTPKPTPHPTVPPPTPQPTHPRPTAPPSSATPSAAPLPLPTALDPTATPTAAPVAA